MTTLFSKPELSFLETYLNTPSPTGFEYEGQKKRLQYIKQYVDTTYVDIYGTAVAVINPKAKFKVVIEAHADEISWFVNYISPEWLIYVIRNGGSDHQIAPSKTVRIHASNGKKIKGIFGWPALHTRKGKDVEVQPKLETIFIDCGCTSAKEVEKLGIMVGDVITYTDEFFILNDRYFVCRALDNRMGGFMIAQVAKLCAQQKKKLPFGIYFVNSVQEEIGLRWAEMIARRINPDVAICTDVTHDTTTPHINKIVEWEKACGKWPVLTRWPAVHNILLKHIQDAAKKSKIAYQMAAVSYDTWTDTDSFAYSNEWVPSALISLPLRYMHTTVEAVSIQDVSATIKLLYQSLVSLKEDQNFNYHR